MLPGEATRGHQLAIVTKESLLRAEGVCERVDVHALLDDGGW